MNAPEATLTKWRCELPCSASGVLGLADPPEAGWRMQAAPGEQATDDAEPLGAPGRRRDRQEGCDHPEEVLESGHAPDGTAS